jgi:hypothetical protein
MPTLKIHFDPIEKKVHYHMDIDEFKISIPYHHDCLTTLVNHARRNYYIRNRSQRVNRGTNHPIPKFEEIDKIYLSALSNFLIPERLLYKLLKHNTDWFIESNYLHIPWDLIGFPTYRCPQCDNEVHLPACNECGRIIGPGLNFFYKSSTLTYPNCFCGRDLKNYFYYYIGSSEKCRHPFDLLTGTRIEIPVNYFISLDKNIIHVPEKLDNVDKGTKFDNDSIHPNILLATAPFPEDYGYLPGIIEEVHEIHKLILNSKTKLEINIDDYLNENASVENLDGILDKKQYDMFYFSGHYEWKSADPGESSLILTGGDKIKLKELEAILGNKYPPRLVFMNACDSAEQTAWGSRVIGLPYLFFNMGSAAFIGTSGSIPDLIAMKIAKKFMYYFMFKNCDIATSIRLSKKDTFQDFLEIDLDGDDSDSVRHRIKKYFNWTSFNIYMNQKGKRFWLTNYFQELRRHVVKKYESYIRHEILPEIFDASQYVINPGFYQKRKGLEKEVMAFINRRGDIGGETKDVSDAPSKNVEGFGVIGSTGIGKTNLLCRLFGDLKSDTETILFFINDLQLESSGLNLIRMTEHCFEEVDAFKKENLNFKGILNKIKDEATTHSVRLIYMIDRVDGTKNPNLTFENIHRLKAFWEDQIAALSLNITVKIIVTAREYAWSNFYSPKILQEDYKNIEVSPVTNELVKNINEFEPSEVSSLLFHRKQTGALNWKILPYDLKQMILNPYLFHLLMSTPNKSKIINESSPRQRQTHLFHSYITKKFNESRKLTGKHNEYQQYLDKIGERMIELSNSQLTTNQLKITGIQGKVIDDLVNIGIIISNQDTHQFQFVFDLLAEFIISNTLFAKHEELDLNRNALKKWLEMLSRLPFENVDPILKGGVEKGLGYWLVKKVTTKTLCREIGQYLLEDVYQVNPQPGVVQSIVDEALVLFGIQEPVLFTYILENLFRESERKIVFLSLSMEVLFAFRFGFHEEYNRIKPLIDFVSNTLINPRIFRLESDRKFFLKKAINLVCSLAVTHEGVFVLEKIFESIFEFEKKAGVHRHIRTMAAFLTQKNNVELVSKILGEEANTIRRKGIINTLFYLLKSNWLFAFKTVIKLLKMRKALGIKISSIMNIKRAVKNSPLAEAFKVFVDISEQALCLGFAFHKDNETRQRLVDLFDKFTTEKLVPEFKNLLKTHEFSKLEEIIKTFCYLIGLLLTEYFTKYFTNSEKPIDPWASISENKYNYVFKLIALLHPGGKIEEIEDFENALVYCFFNPNAFENYLGKTVLIVQGANNLNTVIPIIKKLFVEDIRIYDQFDIPPVVQSKTGEDIPREVKAKRDILSILVFILRRIINYYENSEEVMKLHELIHEMTIDFCRDFEKYLLMPNLLSENDFWHPLSALGVSCGILNKEMIELNGKNYIRYLVGRKAKTSSKETSKLIQRLLFELWPISYFYPGLCLRTLENAIDYIIHELDKKVFDAVQEYIVRTLLVLDLTYSENLKLFFSKQRETGKEKKFYDLLRKDFDEAQKTRDVQEEIVNYFFYSLKTQGSHEGITTVFSEFDFLSSIVVRTLQEAVLNKNTFVELLTALITNGLKEYKNQEYRLWNLIEPRS